jgi:hypothetical protein
MAGSVLAGRSGKTLTNTEPSERFALDTGEPDISIQNMALGHWPVNGGEICHLPVDEPQSRLGLERERENVSDKNI